MPETNDNYERQRGKDWKFNSLINPFEYVKEWYSGDMFYGNGGVFLCI